MFVGFEDAKKRAPKRFRQRPTDSSSIPSDVQAQSKNFYQGVSLPLIKSSLASGKFDLSRKNLENVPKFIYLLNNEIPETLRNLDAEYPWYTSEIITQLSVPYNQITDLSEMVTELATLRYLDLCDNKFTTLPDCFEKLGELVILNCSNNSLREIPQSIANSDTLTSIHLQHNSLCGELSISAKSLKELNLSHNALTSLDIHCPGITKLTATSNKLQSVGLNNAVRLRELDISTNQIELLQIPDNCVALNFLCLANNRLGNFPEGLKKCSKLSKIDLSCNRLKSLPTPLLENFPLTLNSLELSDNNIEALDHDICQYRNLQRLDISKNAINDIPLELALIDSLQVLNISQNPLRKMRSVLGKTTEDVMKYLRNRLPLEKLNACATIPSPRNEPMDPSKLVQITLMHKSLTRVDQVFEHYPELDASNIRTLDLSNNKITDFTGLSKFKNVIDVNFTRNQLSDSSFRCDELLPASIRTINFSQNQIKLQDTAFFDFVKPCLGCIETIILSTNKIEVLDASEWLKFTDVKVIDVSCNNIRMVPPELGKFKSTQLKSLVLDQNPFRVPRSNILANGTSAVLDYLFDRIHI